MNTRLSLVNKEKSLKNKHECKKYLNAYYKTNCVYEPLIIPKVEDYFSKVDAKSISKFFELVFNNLRLRFTRSVYFKKKRKLNGVSVEYDYLLYTNGLFKDLENNNKIVGFVSEIDNKYAFVWDYDFIVKNIPILKFEHNSSHNKALSVVVNDLKVQIDFEPYKINFEKFKKFIDDCKS